MCVEVCTSQSRFRPINKICPLNPDLAIKPKAQITLLGALSNKGELLMEITFRNNITALARVKRETWEDLPRVPPERFWQQTTSEPKRLFTFATKMARIPRIIFYKINAAGVCQNSRLI